MATHQKNNENVRKWRKLNREKYLEYDRKNLLKYYPNNNSQLLR